MVDEILLTVDEAARRLGIGRTFLYSLLRSGELDSVKIGRGRRIPVKALQAFAESLATELE